MAALASLSDGPEAALAALDKELESMSQNDLLRLLWN
jgi:hypothetical protein